MQKITPFLWFDKNVNEAVDFYLSVFPGSRILEKSHADGTPSGGVDIISIELLGTTFTLMGAGPEFKFNEAVSFLIDCKDQEEVDYYWGKLSAVKEAEECGWLKDKFGVSWQVVPNDINYMMKDPEVLQAMLKMKKIIISDLKKIYDANN